MKASWRLVRITQAVCHKEIILQNGKIKLFHLSINPAFIGLRITQAENAQISVALYSLINYLK